MMRIYPEQLIFVSTDAAGNSSQYVVREVIRYALGCLSIGVNNIMLLSSFI